MAIVANVCEISTPFYGFGIFCHLFYAENSSGLLLSLVVGVKCVFRFVAMLGVTKFVPDYLAR